MKEDHTPRKNRDSTKKVKIVRLNLLTNFACAAVIARGLERDLRALAQTFDGGLAMKITDRMKHDRRSSSTDAEGRPRSVELHNDRTHDSTVDTDGKNREAARLAGDGPISPDEETTSNATLDNSVPETPDGLAGFDSRFGAHRLLFATQPGYEVVDKGMAEPQTPDDLDGVFFDPRQPGIRRSPGRIHDSLNHLRPTRIIELRPAKK
jgi:hypothetical protein